MTDHEHDIPRFVCDDGELREITLPAIDEPAAFVSIPAKVWTRCCGWAASAELEPTEE